MDEIRDTQKTDSISRFIDAHSVRTNPFGENRAGERAYRRSERIVAAVHLLTNHIDPNEPVSSAIRGSGLSLLNAMLELRSEMRSSRSELFGKVQAHIRHMISLVRVLTVSGYVSMQNATTMVEALDELGNFMTAAQRSALSESISVSRDDLLDVRSGRLGAPARSVKDMKDSISGPSTSAQSLHGRMSDTSTEGVGQITARSQSILDTLHAGGSMGIKDICSNLPEYSEKMIQRELSDMVAMGKVVKSGLKRWSKYSVVA
jgi:hypothetical protein